MIRKVFSHNKLIKKHRLLLNKIKSKLDKYLIYFFVPFVIYTLKNFVELETIWPGTQIIPGILKIKGLINQDLLSNSLLNSPYKYSIYLLSVFLPASIEKLILIYKGLQIIQFSLAISTTFVLILKLAELYFTDIKIKANTTKIFTCLLMIIFIINPLSRIFGLFENQILHDFFNATNLAGWQLSTKALNPSGISFVITNCTFIYYLKVRKFNIYILLLLLLSTLLHPVVPLNFILFSLILLLVNGREKKYIHIFQAFLTIVLIWMFHLLQSTNFNSVIFFESYLSRHSHHYLVSEIINSKNLLLYLRDISFIIMIIFLKKRFRNKTIIYLLLFNILTVLSILITQYILVEVLRNQTFLLIGITRLLFIHDFIFYLVILIYLLDFKNQINFKIKTNIYNKLNIFLNKSKIFITLFLMTILFLLMSFSYSNSFKSKVNPQEIKDFFIRKNIKNYQIISDTDSKKLRIREFYSTPVYVDSYFPFNINDVIEWTRRKKIKKTILDNKGIFIEDKNIYLISDKTYNYDLLGEIQLQENKYKVYKTSEQ